MYDRNRKEIQSELFNDTPVKTEDNKSYICHASQGDTRHSMPPSRRRGGFNFDDQLIPPPRGDGSTRAIMA